MKNALLLFLVFWFSHTQIFASINVNPLAFGAFRDRVYLQGENGPVEIDGASEINFDLQLVGKPGVTTATLTLDNVSYDLTNLEAPAGFRTNYGYSTYDNEIFDVESSSDSDWGSYINGKTFDFDLTIEGSSYSYSHNLPSVSSLPAAPNISLANILEWEKDSEGYDSAKIQEQDLYEFSWDSFSSAGNNDYIVVHLQELDGDDEIEVISETVLASDSTSFSVNGSNIQIGKTYVFYVEWVKVTEQSNPSGFSYVAGTDTSLPLLQTSAESITALQFALEASTVAISDPNGQPVVVQVGDDYQWNDTLDGVMLWGVWQDDDTNDWVIATVNYVDGRQKGALGSFDTLPVNLDVDHPYIVNNDTIDVTETNGHQYYQVTSVENGIIYAVDGDGAPLTDPSWWFVTKTAAEEFYNSKINYAPSSIVGETLQILEDKYSFTADEVYIIVNDPNMVLGGFSYSYVSSSSTTATLEISGNSNGVTVNEVHQLTFTSPTRADSNYTATDGNGSLTLQILEENHVPNSLAGWTYKGSSMDDTLQFIDSSNAVFYDSSDSNFSRRELSNITYNLEQLGPKIAKLSTSLDEETLLFFDSNTSGHFDWEEMGGEDGVSGKFDLYYYASGHALDSLAGSSITIGDTTYVFTSTNAVTVHSPSGTSSQEYAYLRENEDEVLLSVGSYLYKLDFYNHQYGRIIEGGSGYFSIHHKWATKGWVFYDDLPWIYSNNQGEWMYQVLSNNNATNETELMYYEPWANVWSQNLDLNYTDQRIFSADSEFYWDDYDDFNGTELNSSKWDVGYFGGGEVVTINDGKAHLSGGDFSSNAPIQMPSDLVAAAQGSTEGNTFLFFRSSEILGIEADLTIPSVGNETEVGIYLASLDTSPLESLGIELVNDAYGSFIKLDYLDSAGQESEEVRVGSLNQVFNLRITKLNGNTSHYIDGDLVHTFPSASRDADYWVIGAFNDNGKPYATTADNVRVLRKKAYPQGWMWTEYYPWAYSHETGGWLYFELAKDSAGNPVMNYYDHNTKAWDLYGPSLNQFYDR